MKNLKRLERLHVKISQLENNGRFIESKKLHSQFVKEAAVPVAQPYPYAYPVYPQYQQYPQYPQYPVQYQQYPVQQTAYPMMQQQSPVQPQALPQQPTRPQVPTPQTADQRFQVRRIIMENKAYLEAKKNYDSDIHLQQHIAFEDWYQLMMNYDAEEKKLSEDQTIFDCSSITYSISRVPEFK